MGESDVRTLNQLRERTMQAENDRYFPDSRFPSPPPGERLRVCATIEAKISVNLDFLADILNPKVELTEEGAHESHSGGPTQNCRHARWHDNHIPSRDTFEECGIPCNAIPATATPKS